MKCILVVDDEARILNSIQRQFYDNSLLLTATSGEAALCQASEHQPDVIILDIAMPGMDGYEICRRLRSDPRTRDIMVLFLSARNNIGDRLLAYSCGGDDFLPKPFAAAELKAKVDALFRRRLASPRQQQTADTPSTPEPEQNLAGLLPVCAQCKSIRDEHGNWLPMETYIHTHSKANTTHGICPKCAHESYPDLYKTGTKAAASDKGK